MKQLFRHVSSWRASEVISLWLGSLVGWPLGIVVGWALSDAFTKPSSSDSSSESWNDFAIIVLSGAVGGLICAVLAVWIPLRLIHAHRAGQSALMSCLLMITIVPMTAGVGAVLIPFNIKVPYSAILAVMIASLVCALMTYTLVTSRGKAMIVTQPT